MKRNLILLTIILISVALLISCNQNTESEFPKLTGPYLGQKPPGMTPELFASQIFKTRFIDFTPTLSPNGDEIYWAVYFFDGCAGVILFIKRINDIWTEPQVASFSGRYSDGGPCFSPDGKKLFFHSNRPISGQGEPKDFDIWFVEITESGWSEPINAGMMVNTDKLESHPSVSRNGSIYFNSFLEGYPYDLGIYTSRLENGKYKMRTLMCEKINSKSGFDWCPFIDPDESYILFSSGRDGQEMDDIYCSFKNNDGSWTKPVKLGSNVNTDVNERFPEVSPDGFYLFFARPEKLGKPYFKEAQTLSQLLDRYGQEGNIMDDIYWVDARVIKELKPNHLK